VIASFIQYVSDIVSTKQGDETIVHSLNLLDDSKLSNLMIYLHKMRSKIDNTNKA